MSFYPVWLDPLMWSLLLGGIACFLLAMPKEPSRNRGLLLLAAGAIFGSGIIVWGVTGVLFNRNAPHISATGLITSVHIHTGKSSSTDFHLDSLPGVDLTYGAAIHKITTGEQAAIIYQQGSGRVLDLQILTGPNAQYQTSEPDQTSGSVLCILGGIAIGLFGLLKWSQDPTAAAMDQPRADQTSPDGGVDSASLLHLSDPKE
jgi:hypothetical protein